MISTRFTKAFNVQIPIVGAPMAGVSGGLLAAATANAGALGFIAAGHLEDLDKLQEQIKIFRAYAPSAPLAIGFLGFSSLRNGLCRLERVLAEQRPSVVQFFAPAVVGENIALAHSFGARVMAQVGCESHAIEALESNADCIIAQGKEAGGHGLRWPLGSSTLPLAARVVRLVEKSEKDVTVLAAGGVVDGRGLAAALSLGCDGAVFGTRLWASKEALGHQSFKKALTKAGPDDVSRTIVFDQIQNTYRAFPWPEPFDSSGALTNDLCSQWVNNEESLQCELSRKESTLAKEHREAEVFGDSSLSCIFAGEGVGEISEIESAHVILKRAEIEAKNQIQSLQHLLAYDKIT